ncbi:MAG: hypothetical protein A2V83_02130 [Nitrospirae bacterium RBG_16_64_22]|nr:MAG: hypothetical protein A2V83_02130 [Nitrospirae bacterium RBG_16_64_22]
MSSPDSTYAVVAAYARLSRTIDGWNREAPFLINCYRTYDKLLNIIGAGGPYKRTLDLGCGTGLQTEFLAGISGEVVGIDISDESIRVARGRCGRLRNAAFQVQDARRMSFADGMFDCVVSYGDVLSHIVDGYEDVVSELRRVTVPGGVISLEMDNKWTMGLLNQPREVWSALMTRGGHDTRSWEGMKFKTFTRPEIAGLLRRHDFEILHVHGHNILASAVPDRYLLEQGNRSLLGRAALALGSADLSLSGVFPFNRFGYNMIVTAIKK